MTPKADPARANAKLSAAVHPPLDDYRWLVSDAARPWLAAAGEASLSSVAQVARLRKDLSSERTHLVLEQVDLRKRALDKFSAAGRMFFTPLGLEQATDEWVAAFKAARFTGRTLDLCTGIGGDYLALAARGPCTAVDRDEVMAILAAANLRACGAAGGLPQTMPDVRVAEVRAVDTQDFEAWHIDPDRRPSGRRTTQVDLHEPPPEVIDALRARNPNAAIKLAPAARMPQHWVAAAELEWISRARSCRQLVAWFGNLARDAGKRRATVLCDRSPPRSVVGTSSETPPVADTIERFLFEPDAAVLAAGLEGVLATEHFVASIAPGVAYWTGSQPIADPALSCFEVREVLPLRVKTIQSLLRSRGVGRLEIKKRGVELDPAVLRRQLTLSGDEESTLILTRIGKRAIAILASRVCEA